MAALASGVREGYLDAAGPFFPLLAGAAAAAGVLSPLFLATAEVGTVPPLLAAAAATAAAAAASAAASAGAFVVSGALLPLFAAAAAAAAAVAVVFVVAGALLPLSAATAAAGACLPLSVAAAAGGALLPLPDGVCGSVGAFGSCGAANPSVVGGRADAG